MRIEILKVLIRVAWMVFNFLLDCEIAVSYGIQTQLRSGILKVLEIKTKGFRWGLGGLWVSFGWALGELWAGYECVNSVCSGWVLSEFWVDFGWILGGFWVDFGWCLDGFG
jgi:hypothetical protein